MFSKFKFLCVFSLAFKGRVSSYAWHENCHKFSFRLTGNHQAADDLSQETFLKAFMGLSHFLDGYDFSSWLRRIALNLCLTYLRKNKRESQFNQKKDEAVSAALASSSESPQEALEKLEMEMRFQEALHSLPQDQKIIFILKTYENMSYLEIAEALGLHLGTVMSRLNRARKKLRRSLTFYLGGKRCDTAFLKTGSELILMASFHLWKRSGSRPTCSNAQNALVLSVKCRI